MVSLKDYAGKVLLVNFWATYCPPCRKEMPEMESLYREFKDQGFEILAIATNPDEEPVDEFVKNLGFTYPILLDLDNNVSRRYSLRFIPTSYLVDKYGIIIEYIYGPRNWYNDKHRKLIRGLLQ